MVASREYFQMVDDVGFGFGVVAFADVGFEVFDGQQQFSLGVGEKVGKAVVVGGHGWLVVSWVGGLGERGASR